MLETDPLNVAKDGLTLMEPEKHHGLALTCSLQGSIDSVICDDLHLDVARHVGESFVRLVDPASIAKALNFLAELKHERSVTGWELNVLSQGQIVTLQFAGFRRDDAIFIVGAEQNNETIHLLDDLAIMNNEQINKLRQIAKEQARAIRSSEAQVADYAAELMKINNELVTLQRELSQKNRDLERLNAQKNQLLGMVAHDLRNPLAVIIDYCDFLASTAGERLNPSEAEYLQEIHNSSRFMLAMVGDLLDLSAVESGRLNLDLHAVEIEPLARRVIALARPQAERKGIVLEMTCEDSLPPVLVDEFKVQQVLTNLVSNAIKFSSPGTQTRVRLRRCDEGACVEVQDQGPGIPPDEVSKLFKPYSRTSVRTTGGESSTGLGLAICRRIVEGHGGQIMVESQLGVGTMFRFTLPRAVGATAVSTPPALATSTAEALRQDGSLSAAMGISVLLVEDNAVNRKVLTQNLTRLGCRVDVAEDGAAALNAAGSTLYDVIFLDYHLPDMTAPDIMERLDHAALKRPRVCVLTGGLGVEETEKCRTAGIERILLKPISRTDLQQALLG